MIEVHILPEFGERRLASLTTEEIGIWERRLLRKGYSKRTSKDARSVLITLLGDAIPVISRSIRHSAEVARAGKDYGVSSGTRKPRKYGRRRFKRF